MNIRYFLFSLLFSLILIWPAVAAEIEIKPDIPVKQNPSGLPQIPDYLLFSTNASIDLMNHLNRMDADKAQETINVIAKRIPLIRAEAKKQNFSPFMVDVLENYIKNLPHTVAEGEYYEATVTTNQIVGIYATMIAYYNPRVPFVLGHIDYLLQDVYIHSNFGEFDYAMVRYNDIGLDWKGGLINDVKSHKGNDLADRFEKGLTSLEALIRAKDVPGIEKQVKDLKKIVIDMEGLY